MGRKIASYRRHAARLLAILFLIFQGVVLDFYLIRGEGSLWYAWVVTDVIVLGTWIAAMVKSYQNLNKKKRQDLATPGKGFFDDELAFAYVAWFIYALHFVPQVATMFKMKADELEEKTMVFGPNMLKMCLCITPVLFLFLVFAHHDAQPYTKRKIYVEKILGAVALDLFDSVEMLEYLFDKEHINFSIEAAILTFASINVFLPSLALYELKHNKFHESGQVASVSFKIVYIFGFLVFVNVPFLVIRLILWHSYNLDISVLLAKNALAIILGLIEIFEFCGDERPRKCDICGNTFMKSAFKKHNEKCMNEFIPLESLVPIENKNGHLEIDEGHKRSRGNLEVDDGYKRNGRNGGKLDTDEGDVGQKRSERNLERDGTRLEIDEKEKRNGKNGGNLEIEDRQKRNERNSVTELYGYNTYL